MMDIFLNSFLLSVVLVGIHAYFGREIVKRGIIFTDIAVAQFSGVGLALSLLLFHGEHLYLFFFGFFPPCKPPYSPLSKDQRIHRSLYRPFVCFGFFFCGSYPFLFTLWYGGAQEDNGQRHTLCTKGGGLQNSHNLLCYRPSSLF